MRFLVGALVLAVLGVLVGAPAAFLLGWAPDQVDRDPYSERLTREVLAGLTSG